MSLPDPETDRILTRLAEIKPLLIGWRRGQAIKILDQCRKGSPMKGWQEDGQAIIDHFNAEVTANMNKHKLP